MTVVHVRAADFEYSEGQLFGRLVPYDVPARVVDVRADGSLDVYQEGFRSGAFARQLGSSEPAVLRRVAFWHTHDHSEGAGYLGPARSLEDKPDGLHGEFRVLSSKRGDVADLLEEGHNKLSIEFREMNGGTDVDGDVRWRTRVHLGGVALDPKGAYPGAEVLSFRSIDELVAEAAEEQEAELRRAEEAASVAAVKAAEEAAADAAIERAMAKSRQLAEVEAWEREQRLRQVELAQRFG